MSQIYEKSEWREKNIAFIQAVERSRGQGLIKRGRITDAYVLDLAGESIHDVAMAFSSLVPMQNLLLVERDLETWLRGKLSLRQAVEVPLLKKQEAIPLASAINMGTVESPFKVGALCLDTLDRVSPSWWGVEGKRVITQVIKPVLPEFRIFPFIANFVLDGVWQTDSIVHACEQHAKTLAQVILDQFDFYVPQLLPRRTDMQARIEDKTYEGSLGVFEIYKSKNKKWLMLTLRAYFQKNGVIFTI